MIAKILVAVALFLAALIGMPFIFIGAGCSAVVEHWVLTARAHKGHFPPRRNHD